MTMGDQLSVGFFLTSFCISTSLRNFGLAHQQVPCYFVFGDSLEDNGNNTPLISLARPNYFPYGIDYPSGATGRFNNGRTTSDFIGEYLGLENDIPPYANSYGSDILKGVNYASGGAGILSESGIITGDRIGFSGQLQNHAVTVSQIFSLLGENATSYLSTCIYLVRLGSNDYLNNYLLPVYDTSKRYNPTEYATYLTQQYSQKLKTLYKYGARKIIIFGLGPIGCAPFEIANSGSNKCSDIANNDGQIFDAMLPPLVDSLNHDLTDSRFIFINVTNIFLATKSDQAGITNRNTSCCNVLPTGLCIPYLIPCEDRDTYFFWDSFHPTEHVNQFLAKRAYSAVTKFDAYPYDIRTLANMVQ